MTTKSQATIEDLYRVPENGKAETVLADNTGSRISLPNRGSFSPDAAWYIGKPTEMKFLEGAPVFAVEVRSEGDYGLKAEQRLLRCGNALCLGCGRTQSRYNKILSRQRSR